MLIAIFILILALTATIVLIVTSVRAGRESINKLVATNLAREGIEVVRNIRDSNWISPSEVCLDNRQFCQRQDVCEAAVNTGGCASTWLQSSWDDGLKGDHTYVPIMNAEITFYLSGMTATAGFTDPNATVYYSPSENIFFQADAGGPLDLVPSGFVRVIYLSDICLNDDDSTDEQIISKGAVNDCAATFDGPSDTYSKVGIRVISEVRWPDIDGRKVIIEDRLYNWQTL